LRFLQLGGEPQQGGFISIPPAIAAADPLLDPPGVWFVFQGLRVGPCNSGSVIPFNPNSGQFVFPKTIISIIFFKATHTFLLQNEFKL
jgi:hypothetical protein